MRTTETTSNYTHLEFKSIQELISIINSEDQKVAHCVAQSMPQIESLIQRVVIQLLAGGRLFYIGSGTSGRLGIVDASECPPTFGVSDKIVIGIIAGGDKAIRKAQEFAEDDKDQGFIDLKCYNINENDFVIGIAASGSTPYVIGAVQQCRENHIPTGCITCNTQSDLASNVDFPIEVVVGPEVVTGSTRMKSGTAQKLVLNMISTTAMIKLGRIKNNKMVDMQLTNHKLIERGIDMIVEHLNIPPLEAKNLLKANGSVRKVLEKFTGE